VPPRKSERKTHRTDRSSCLENPRPKGGIFLPFGETLPLIFALNQNTCGRLGLAKPFLTVPARLEVGRYFMERESVIVSDPEILGGTPCFRGTRVPVDSLIDYLEAGDTLDEFLDNFPSVSREAAIAALEEAKALLTNSR
jgi:uncharacterized protein (DUF433 family)